MPTIYDFFPEHIINTIKSLADFREIDPSYVPPDPDPETETDSETNSESGEILVIKKPGDDALLEPTPEESVLEIPYLPRKEVCGFIVKNSLGELEVVPSPNLDSDPENSFRTCPRAYLEAESKGQIVAIYHSHTKDEHPGYLTSEDIYNCKKEGIPFILYHPEFQDWDYYDPNNIVNPYPLTITGNPKEIEYYLGWRWVWSRCDCFSLVRAFYKGYLDIYVGDYSRPLSYRGITLETWNAFEEYLPLLNFVKIEEDEPRKPYDLAILAYHFSSAHHAIIFLENTNHFLHLLDEDNPSTCAVYGSDWADSAKSFWRHRNFL